MRFEWDELKNKQNNEKHGVCFKKAQEAFFDANRVLLFDEKHSEAENRYFCLGEVDKKIMTVRFTIRDQAIRIIGAGYWREGKRRYEQENNI